MHIVVLTGSPHKNGATALLADNFIDGATRAGNTVFRFDAAFECVHPCIGCDTCQGGANPCVFQDDMQRLYPEIKKADMVVFVSPLYYHSMSSQIRMVIDRFHGIDNELVGSKKRTMLFMAGASVVPTIFDGAIKTYRETAKYLGWQDCGVLPCFHCKTREDMERTNYPAEAFKMGRILVDGPR